MRTGRYRVRKGWFGKAILQAEYNTPSYTGAQVCAHMRDIFWEDVEFRHAPTKLEEISQQESRG